MQLSQLLRPEEYTSMKLIFGESWLAPNIFIFLIVGACGVNCHVISCGRGNEILHILVISTAVRLHAVVKLCALPFKMVSNIKNSWIVELL